MNPTLMSLLEKFEQHTNSTDLDSGVIHLLILILLFNIIKNTL